MKAIRYKTKLLLGFILFLSGTLMIQMPVYISLDHHFLLSQLLLVIGSITIFFGFAMLVPGKQ